MEFKQHLSVESWPGVLQINQKHIKTWKVGTEAELVFPVSEVSSLPVNAKTLSTGNYCKSNYPGRSMVVEDSIQRILVELWRRKLLRNEKESSSDFERQSAIGKVTKVVSVIDESKSAHEKMIKFEPSLEASG